MDKQKVTQAFSELIGVMGVWENQKGAPKPSNPHFSLKLMFPGVPSEFRAEGNSISRKSSTLELKLFDIAPDPVITGIHTLKSFRKALREAGVVFHDIINAFDLSAVFEVMEPVFQIDMRISWVDEIEQDLGEIVSTEINGIPIGDVYEAE